MIATSTLLIAGAALLLGAAMVWLLYRGPLRRAHDEHARTRQELEARLEKAQAELSQIRISEAELRTRLVQEERRAQEQVALLDEARTRLADAFQALSAEALKSNNQAFLDLAHASMERHQVQAQGELEKRQQAITELVGPVQRSLVEVQGKLGEIERSRVEAYAALREQVAHLTQTEQELRAETGKLVKALRQPTVRGRWGEIQLRRVVELAGMQDHCDFHEQVSSDDEDGRIRPDLVVSLPGGKQIVVDAKTPLSAYLEAIESEDEEGRRQKLVEHARAVRNHMAELAKKSYWDRLPATPEFVVMFLPGEVFFSAALEQDPSLIELGVEQAVILATPTTLISLLRAVSYGWRQERIAESAEEISRLGRELYDRVAKLSEHMSGVGKNLGRAVDAYNQAVGSLETRVLVSARRFEELDVVPAGQELESPPQIEKQTRALQAPELLED